MNRADILAVLPDTFTAADLARVLNHKAGTRTQERLREMVRLGEAVQLPGPANAKGRYRKTGKVHAGPVAPRQVTFRVSPDEYAAYMRLGGSDWARAQIRAAMSRAPRTDQQTWMSGLGNN